MSDIVTLWNNDREPPVKSVWFCDSVGFMLLKRTFAGARKCPLCGKSYTSRPAVSRRDNETSICPDCGTREALEKWGGVVSMSLTMTPEDICKECRTAKNRVKQIGVLAELNACTKKEIVDVLKENGEKLPGNVGPRKGGVAASFIPGTRMEESEIVKLVIEANNPRKRIKELAERNACAEADIIGILNEAGVKLPAVEADVALTSADVNYKEKPEAPEPCEVPPDAALRRLGVIRMLIVKAFGGSNAHELEAALLLYEDMRRAAGI